MGQESFICHSCGKKVEYSGRRRLFETLNGWVMISLFKGPGAVEHHNFCSLTCLKTWLDSQTPEVPNVFLKAFEQEKE